MRGTVRGCCVYVGKMVEVACLVCWGGDLGTGWVSQVASLQVWSNAMHLWRRAGVGAASARGRCVEEHNMH